jgi:hypothetical protein
MEHLYNLAVKGEKWKNIARVYRNERGNLFLSFLVENDKDIFERLNNEFDKAQNEGKKYVNINLFENVPYEETDDRHQPVLPKVETTRGRQPVQTGRTNTSPTTGRTRTTRITRTEELDDEIPF